MANLKFQHQYSSLPVSHDPSEILC